MSKMFLFVFVFLTSIFSTAYTALYDKWQQTETLWNYAIISSCNKGIITTPIEHFKNVGPNTEDYLHIESGDIVWVPCRFLPTFFQEYLSQVEHSFVIVISDGDESFPSAIQAKMDVEKFIQDDKIIHIFAQNYDYKGSSIKVSRLPIGLDFHTLAYKDQVRWWGDNASPIEQEAALDALLKELAPTSLRKKRAYVDFQLNDSTHGDQHRYLEMGEDRNSIFERLQKTGLVDYPAGQMKRLDLWRMKGQYAFSVSPHGNGLDCHRTWEDLMLGCIVIVKTSSLDPLYEGLPVIIVKDWSEVTEENFDLWLKKYGDAFTNDKYREKLTIRYWLTPILEYAKQYKERVSSPVPLYFGLPVILTKDWSKVTKENFDPWLEKYGDLFTKEAYREKLNARYWSILE